MNTQPTALIILFMMAVLVIIVLLYGFYIEVKERKLPRWKRVHHYLLREFLQDDFIHSQADVLEVRNILVDRYKLTPEEAYEAVENLYNEEWFELNIT